jgi:cytoplasmic iron level regulating protein YaaA (DUF328/UPF0246 family)
MLAVLSPAKTLDTSPTHLTLASQPAHLDQSERLVEVLRPYSAGELGELMSISDRLARLNHQRYADFHTPFDRENAKQALLTFKGDTYRDMGLEDFTDRDFEYAQRHLRILSGLYGVLRPLDLIQAYRLEMGTKLETSRGKNLYEFWGDRITDQLNADLSEIGSDVLVNLASNEYFKSVKVGRLAARVIQPVFKDYRKGRYIIISFFAKKARGAMAAFMIRERIESPAGLEHFGYGGYRFSEGDSDETQLVFLRRED